jgi:hypothetical protein
MRAAVLLAVLTGTMALASCGKLSGTFAFKKPIDDVYRKLPEIPEFSRDEVVDWVCVLKGVGKSDQLAVFLLKKELVWVELHSRLENVREGRAYIYGTIQDLARGRYKIMIAKESSVVGEQEFDIYDDNDDGVFDK